MTLFFFIDLKSVTQVLWRDSSNVKIGYQCNTGIPFVVLGRKRLDCTFGPDRKLAVKQRKKATGKRNPDHGNYSKGKGFQLFPTRKVNCPAQCVIRHIVRFPSYKERDEKMQNQKGEDLLTRLKRGEIFPHENTFILCLSGKDCHIGHTTDNIIEEDMDPAIASEIRKVIGQGITDTNLINNHIKKVVSDVFKDRPVSPPSHSRRYFPSDRKIQRHKYVAKGLKVSDDRENVFEWVQSLKKKHPRDFVYCELKDEDATECAKNKKFVFIHQSCEQRRLLERYGCQVVMDATYKTTAYDMPLFLIGVKTNVDYQVIATFAIEDETSLSISEALAILKREWNFSPSFFITDFDEAQIHAIQEVFTESRVIICDFHRKQAWERWTSKIDNVLGRKDDILKLLNHVAEAKNPQTCDAAVTELRASEIYYQNAKFRHYFDRIWGPHMKKWCKAYRYGLFDIQAHTTNGIEVQHRILKNKFLRGNSQSSFTAMMKTVVEVFLPSRYRVYVDLNVESEGLSKMYNKEIPPELYNRPKNFIKNCMQAMEKAKDTNKSMLAELDLGDDQHFPTCTCADWCKSLTPCKHMFSAMTENGQIEWSRLSPMYMASNFCQVDGDVCKTERVEDAANMKEQEFEETIQDTIETGIEKEEVPASTKENESEETIQDTVETGIEKEEVPASTKENESEDTEIDVKKLRIECRDWLKLLMSKTYNISVKQDLCMLINSLKTAYESITRQNDKTHFLPLRRRKILQRKHRRISKRGQKKSRVARKTREVYAGDNVVNLEQPLKVFPHLPNDSDPFRSPKLCEETIQDTVETGIEKEEVPASTKENESEVARKTREVYAGDNVVNLEQPLKVFPHLPNDSDPFRSPKLCEDVSKIWKSKPKDRLLGTIGPYRLTDQSIKCVQAYLSDEVIDGFIHLLVCDKNKSGKKVCHVDCIGMTAIFERQRHIHYCMRGVSGFLDYSVIIGAINEGGNHWCLISEFCQVFHPMLPLAHLSQKYVSINKFLQCRWEIGLEKNLPERWELCIPPHAKQPDGSSCGLYVLKFAENFLHGKPLVFDWNAEEIKTARLSLASYLLTILQDEPLQQISDKPSIHDEEVQQTREETDQCSKRSSIFLRKDRKKKRKSSYEYFVTPKRRRQRLYCICQKPDDGRKYWQCELCKDWFHPDCVGQKEECEPSEYICLSCEGVSSNPEKHSNQEKLTDNETEETEEHNEVEQDRGIDQNYINGVFGEVKTFLYDIMQCETESCEESCHNRHHMFMLKRPEFLKANRRRILYGQKYFSEDMFQQLLMDLTNAFVYAIRDPKFPATGLQIKLMKNLPETSQLQQILMQDKMVAHKYILNVLLKEAMAYMVSLKTGMPLETAEERCRSTEVDL